LGAIRSAAQMVSYEVSIGLIIMNIVLVTGSLNVRSIVEFQEYVWFIVPFSPLFILFFISSLAETNRAPFDLPEAEGELVAGFNVEYSSTPFALFFIGEYVSIFFMATLSVFLFFGGWLAPNLSFLIPSFIFCLEPLTSLKTVPLLEMLFIAYSFENIYEVEVQIILASLYQKDYYIILFTYFVKYILSYTFLSLSFLNDIFILFPPFILALKINIMVFIFLWVRASVPRYRYDVLMQVTWKYFLPLSFGFLIITSSALFMLDAFPK